MLQTEPPWVIAVIGCSRDEHARHRRAFPYLAAIAVVRRGYRPFECANCRQQIDVCGPCDGGKKYCSPTCTAAGRRRSIQRAGKRYQRTRKGRRKNALRQRRYRARRPARVTHQSSAIEGTSRILQTDLPARPLARAAMDERPRGQGEIGQEGIAFRHGEAREIPDDPGPERQALVRCHFCGCLCSPPIRDHGTRIRARARWRRAHRGPPRR